MFESQRGRIAGAIAALSLAAALAVDPSGAAAGERWPRWPTEITRIAAPLHAEEPQRPSDSVRVHAVTALGRYAKGAMAHELASALRDPSVAVQQEALRLCLALAVEECIPGAAALWGGGHEPQIRRQALAILALDPAPSRLAILLGALRDSNDEIRSGAAEALGSAPLSPDARRQVRAELVAKLSDVNAGVRRHAVASLGLLAPGNGTLAMARLLDDPDPDVRLAAAQALGHHGDPGVVPALGRAVRANNEARVSEATAVALAQLPGRDVDETLLSLLDDPPEGVSAMQIATAIGRRPEPDPLLTQGLIQRLREDNLRAAALTALLWLGESARPAIVQVRARGMEPDLDVELARLLGALDLPKKARRKPSEWPEPGDREAWHRLLRSPDVELRHEASLALADQEPGWLDDAVAGALSAPENGPPPGPWLLVLARGHGKLLSDRGHELPWAKVVGWARRGDLATGHRCLAVAALGSAGTSRARARIAHELDELLADPRAAIRGCATLALTGFADDVAQRVVAMLHDPSAQVRVSAALALAALPAEQVLPPDRAALALARERDPSAAARRAARFALHRLAADVPVARRPGWFIKEVPAGAWVEPVTWATVEAEGMELLIPVHGDHERRWAVVPGLADARMTSSELPLPRRTPSSDD